MCLEIPLGFVQMGTIAVDIGCDLKQKFKICTVRIVLHSGRRRRRKKKENVSFTKLRLLFFKETTVFFVFFIDKIKINPYLNVISFNHCHDIQYLLWHCKIFTYYSTWVLDFYLHTQ